MRNVAIIGLIIWGFSATTAVAHTRWDTNGPTPPRTSDDAIKTGPCGAARGSDPTVLEPGAELEVAFESTIYHEGEFRIAFSPAGDEGFDEHVLADNIPDRQGERYRTQRITLPNVTCEECTLQLIQSMPDRTPTTYYYSCADIALRAAPAAVSEVGASAEADGDGIWLRWSAGRQALWVVAPEPVTFAPVTGAQYAEGDQVGNGEVLHLGASGAMRVALAPGTYHLRAYGVEADLTYSDGEALPALSLAQAPPPASTGAAGAGLMLLLAVVGLRSGRRRG